jgi:phospholipase C
VSWIVTQDPLTEHGPDDVSWGERFSALTVNSLAAGPQWKDSALILSYDENGGFYDHVLPPRVDELGLGFRVPGIVVSPFAKAGHVSSTVYEHCSALALIERTFGLKPLTARDAAANPYEDAFDFSRREPGFVDYPERSLVGCGGMPVDWYARLLAQPVPASGTPGRVPPARQFCESRPTPDLGAGVAAGVGAGAAAAVAGVRRRGGRARPGAAAGTPTPPASRPRTRP